MNELHLFAGAGGGILAGALLGHRCIGAVEIEPYAQAVLLARQRDGSFPRFPIFSDVRRFDGRPWRGRVDIVAGGFPCQDISVAGKGAGLDGERSGLWREMARIVSEVRPRYVFVENSPAIITRGLGVVLSDLAALGYDCRWTVLGAADVGAPHQRDRFWLVARSNGNRLQEREHVIQSGGEKTIGKQPWGTTHRVSTASDHADPDSREQSFRRPSGRMGGKYQPVSWNGDWTLEGEPVLGRDANGMAHRIDRLKALGNGQVPRVAAAAFAELIGLFS